MRTFRSHRLLCLLGLISGMCLGVYAQSVGAETCKLQKIASFKTERIADGRILLPVSIEQQPVDLLLDTGSAITSMLFADTVAKLGLHPLEIQDRFKFASGREVNHLVIVKSFDLGSLHVGNAKFLADLAAPTDQAPNAIAGLLGPDIIGQLDIEIDPANNALNLFSPDHCPGRVVYWTVDATDAPLRIVDSGHMFLSMMLDGKPIEALVDTGSAGTYLSLPAAQRIFGLSSDSPGVTAMPQTGEGLSSPLKHFHYAFKSLSVGGIQIMHPAITMLEDKIQKTGDRWDLQIAMQEVHDEEHSLGDLVLGMNILNKLHFYIARKESRLYASAANSK